jgi:hypothetical protein
VFLASYSLVLALGVVWARDEAAPRVTVLGSGRGLSLLISAGPARLLIANGDDAAAFGNALARARHPGRHRIDVLLLARSHTTRAVVAKANRDLAARHTEVIGEEELLGELGLTVDHLLDGVRRFQLPDGVSVTVEVVDVVSPSRGQATNWWRAVVERGNTRLVVLSDGRGAGAFADPGPVSALVLAGDHPVEAITAVRPGALIVNAMTVSGRDVRRELAPAVEERLWTLRVHPGDVERLDFTPQGLRLPDHALLIEPSPATAFLRDAVAWR